MRLWALPKDVGSRRELKIEELWPHKGYLVLKFEGVDSISEAESLIGCELQVPARERSKLEPGWAYISDLVGCVVLDGDHEIGSVADVRFGAGEAPLLVVKTGSKEYEIPYAEAYLSSTDLEHKRIFMSLPEGMLELNAPLTAEEKEQQKNSRKLSS
jgi:16S rRNA processing protein RimM